VTSTSTDVSPCNSVNTSFALLRGRIIWGISNLPLADSQSCFGMPFLTALLTILQSWPQTLIQPSPHKKLQTSLLAIQRWLTKWRLKANGTKSTHVTFTTCRATCPPVHIYNELPQAEEVKYLGCWLLGRKSRLSMSNKLLLYKVILKPI
jgi:hypothetical protein